MKTSLKVNTRPYIRCFFALGYGWKWPQKWPFVATKRAGSAGPGQSLHLHAKEDQHNFLVLKVTQNRSNWFFSSITIKLFMMYNHSIRDLINSLPVPQESVDFFTNFPFVQPYLNPSSPYKLLPFITRYEKDDPSDRFFSKTINTHDTVPRALAFMRNPDSSQSSNHDDRDTIDPSKGSDDAPHFVVFYQLESGVNGFINTAHGGIMASLLDEAIGLCAETYRIFVSNEQAPLLTADLQLKYRSPVSTPGVIVIKSWVRRKEGRKWFLEARVLGENGLLKAEAKSVYARPRSSM